MLTRVLVVDDKEENLYYLQTLLAGNGCEVETARHGAEALVIARQAPPDLIISDLLMPVMDGYTLLRHWKADARLKLVPFVVYTATYTESEDEQLALNLGADGFILKPSEPDAFLDRVLEVLARASSAAPGMPRQPNADDTAVLKVYSETLIRKLEEKTLQLEEANRALQEDLLERERAAVERQSLLHDLHERVKELDALRSAASILQDDTVSGARLLQRIADLLPPAMQHPDVAAARVTFGAETCQTKGFEVTEWRSETSFATSDGLRGSIEVVYLEERPPHRPDPFLAEEKELLRSLADMLRLHFERQRAESALRAREVLLRTATRIARLGAWAVDLPARTVIWSDALRDILNVPPGVQPSLAEALALYPPEWRTTVVGAVEALAAEGTPFDLEVESDTFSGRRLWVRVCGEAERREDGSIARLHGALQDLTERKSLERQFLRTQRLESIGTLAGGIAHDLNNVLSPIMMSAALLMDGEQDPSRVRLIETIEKSAQRGADMVRQVLSFARGVEGRPAETHLGELIADVHSIIRETFPKDIEPVVAVPDDLWPVHADGTQLHQVLMNLCVNARDAMPQGGRLRLVAENVHLDESYPGVNLASGPGPYVRLSVVDSGSGMPKEIQDRVFEPFFSTKEVGKGTGLGLSTVLTIVRSHGGFVNLSSEPGRGTHICVHLPARPDPAPAEPAADRAASLPHGTGELVLVVDDEEGIRKVTQQTLERYGYRVMLAVNGAEAVALYATHHREIAVVLTDMAMPVMDGSAAIVALKAINPEAKIIACSGHAVADGLAQALAEGVQHFIPKPYTAEDMLCALHAQIGRS